jgi:hypothetical protein
MHHSFNLFQSGHIRILLTAGSFEEVVGLQQIRDIHHSSPLQAESGNVAGEISAQGLLGRDNIAEGDLVGFGLVAGIHPAIDPHLVDNLGQ